MKPALIAGTTGIGLLAFSTSLLWYSPYMFGDIWRAGAGASLETSASWKFAVAPLREIATAFAMLFVLRRTIPLGTRRTVVLALVLWAGFYGVQLAGAVVWDNMSAQLGTVHAGDWLVKLVIISLGVSWAMKWVEAPAPSAP
jgi:hypothetical protein